MSQETDENYSLLTQIPFSGIYTPKITWGREGDMAIATFNHYEDATHFVHGYLDFWDVFIKEDTPESMNLRGKIREELLPKKSLVSRVEIPERAGAGQSVTIKIPLNIIDTNILKSLAEAEFKIHVSPGNDFPALIQ